MRSWVKRTRLKLNTLCNPVALKKDYSLHFIRISKKSLIRSNPSLRELKSSIQILTFVSEISATVGKSSFEHWIGQQFPSSPFPAFWCNTSNLTSVTTLRSWAFLFRPPLNSLDYHLSTHMHSHIKYTIGTAILLSPKSFAGMKIEFQTPLNPSPTTFNTATAVLTTKLARHRDKFHPVPNQTCNWKTPFPA